MNVWIVNTEELNPVLNLKELTGLLPEHEQKKAAQYLFPADSLRYVAGRILIHSLAAVCGGNTNSELSFSEYGKPRFVSDALPFFNLSHSGKMIVLAFGDIPVGVDVEGNAPIDYRELMTVFGEEEKERIHFSPEPEKTFYRIWTVREAFSKEEGIGLSIFDTADVQIDYNSETIRYLDKKLHFRTMTFPGHTVSLCAKDLTDLQVHKLTEDAWNRLLDLYDEGKK